MIYENVLDLIGRTPTVKISKIMADCKNNNNMFIKLESKNPGGSSKDRIAYKMIRSLLDNKKINENSTIVEVTSGNTGIGLAMVCAYYNLKLIIVINESVTYERIKILELYGAKIIKVCKNKGMEHSIHIAKEICKRIENSVYINQFDNFDNLNAHYEKTANEIIEDFENDLDYIFVGMGSTGTIMGISKKMKELKKEIKIIGVEPSSCSFYKNNVKGEGDIPGIGTTFIPYIYNKKLIDEILLVDKQKAITCMETMLKKEGINVGMSSGAVVCAGIEYLEKNKISDKNVLFICPDSVDRYLSIL